MASSSSRRASSISLRRRENSRSTCIGDPGDLPAAVAPGPPADPEAAGELVAHLAGRQRGGGLGVSVEAPGIQRAAAALAVLDGVGDHVVMVRERVVHRAQRPLLPALRRPAPRRHRTRNPLPFVRRPARPRLHHARRHHRAARPTPHPPPDAPRRRAPSPRHPATRPHPHPPLPPRPPPRRASRPATDRAHRRPHQPSPERTTGG